MMNYPNDILEEHRRRPIKAVWWNNGTDGYMVGFPKIDPVTRISAYTINGQMAEVLWFMVFFESGKTVRVNAAHITEVHQHKGVVE